MPPYYEYQLTMQYSWNVGNGWTSPPLYLAGDPIAGSGSYYEDAGDYLVPYDRCGLIPQNYSISIESGVAAAVNGLDALVTTAAKVGPRVSEVTHARSRVRCDGRRATVVGTSGDDTLYGTNHHDVIAALDGNDTMYGFGADDLMCGGRGQDGLVGGARRDRLIGGSGGDTVLGGAGSDVIFGAAVSMRSNPKGGMTAHMLAQAEGSFRISTLREGKGLI